MISNEQELMNKILNCYIRLSPENLWCDGEATRAHAMATAKKINTELKGLFKQLGRVVTEEEAYQRDWKIPLKFS